MESTGRKKTLPVKVGNVTVGGDAPVVVQSMTSTATSDTAGTLKQIRELAEAGCELVRLAVPARDDIRAFSYLAGKSPVPLVADIHFDPKLALEAMAAGAAKIRINPGNIGGRDMLRRLVQQAEKMNVAIRIGVNAGSLEKKLLAAHGGPTAEALVESALGYLEVTEELGYDQVIVSLKASDVLTTINAYRLFSEKKIYPLHLGVTEAGPLFPGLIKSAVGIGTLLAEGIGDTVRVSLTASPVEEVRAAQTIIQSLGLKQYRPDLVSCPTCGRCTVDLISLAGRVEDILKGSKLPLKVAVMGCAVNGPGEAREADLGITAGKKKGIIFRHGKVIRTVDPGDLLEAFEEEMALLSAKHERISGGDG